MKIDIKREINPSDFEVGCIVARFQVHMLHDAHKAILDLVYNNHKPMSGMFNIRIDMEQLPTGLLCVTKIIVEE